MTSNYGCAFTKLFLDETTLHAISAQMTEHTDRQQFCDLVRAHCTQHMEAQHMYDEKAVELCTLYSTTKKFESPLIAQAASVHEIETKCCCSSPTGGTEDCRPDSRCFQPPGGESACAAPKRRSDSAPCPMPSNFENLDYSDLSECQRRTLAKMNDSMTHAIDERRAKEEARLSKGIDFSKQ